MSFAEHPVTSQSPRALTTVDKTNMLLLQEQGVMSAPLISGFAFFVSPRLTLDAFLNMSMLLPRISVFGGAGGERMTYYRKTIPLSTSSASSPPGKQQSFALYWQAIEMVRRCSSALNRRGRTFSEDDGDTGCSF
jgi:hypothetical protein